ncbi:MAG: hypothetical protein AAF226_09410 [Verrucomicrobiota bacterium]
MKTTVLLILLSTCGFALAQGPPPPPPPGQSTAPPPPPPSAAPVAVKDPLLDLEASISGNEVCTVNGVAIRLGDPISNFTNKLGVAQNSGTEFWEATGEYAEEWRFPDVGLLITASSLTKNGAKEIRSITIQEGSSAKTRLAIGVGSTPQQVMLAYGQRCSLLDSEPGETILIGDYIDAIIFTLKDYKVASIFIGPAAE